jgi:surface antigen
MIMKTELDKITDPSELDAYLDGALGDDERRRIELRLERDPAAADYVDTARRLNQALGEHTRRIDQAPMSQGLQDALNQLRPTAEVISLADRFPSLRPLQALAAGLFVLTIGYGSGHYMAGQQIEQQALAMQEIRDRVREEVRKTMNHALEYRPSGEVVTWNSDTEQASAELRPVRTFRTADQRYCREFHETIIIDGVREERRGLSCRVGKEDWQTRMLLAEGTESTVF